MTLAEMENLDREYISVAEAASVIGCSPQLLRDGLDIDETRPVGMRRYMFPHCKNGNRHSIMREGFIRWVRGELITGLPNPKLLKELCRVMNEYGGGDDIDCK